MFLGDHKAYRLSAWLQSAGVQNAGQWQLYNLSEDPSELNNLAEQEPERLAVALYAQYGEDVGVIDVGPDFNPVSVIAVGSDGPTSFSTIVV